MTSELCCRFDLPFDCAKGRTELDRLKQNQKIKRVLNSRINASLLSLKYISATHEDVTASLDDSR